MSRQKRFIAYDKYLESHISSVEKAYQWMQNYLIIPENILDELQQNIAAHDNSKYSIDEYYPYADYFYGDNKNATKVKTSFNYAWLHHIHANPHHWQYWILQNDEDGTELLDMPDVYIYEMVADWWSFSWRSENLFEIFNWYELHKKSMLLSTTTRDKVEQILENIKNILDKQEADE